MRSTFIILFALLTLAACGEKTEVAPPVESLASPPAAAPAAPEATVAVNEPPAGIAPAANPGQLKYVAICQGCHGRDGAGQGPFPKLAGKTAAELAAKLKDYRAGKQVGPQSSTMMPFAKPLTDAEIDVIAGYLATL